MFYVKVLGVYYLWPTEYNNKTSQSSFYQHAPFTQLDSKGERLSKIGKSYSARLSAVRNLSKISDDATFLDIFLQFKKIFNVCNINTNYYYPNETNVVQTTGETSTNIQQYFSITYLYSKK